MADDFLRQKIDKQDLSPLHEPSSIATAKDFHCSVAQR